MRESLWIVPFIGGALGWLLGLASADFGAVVDLSTRWQYSATTAEAVLAAVVAASVGLVGFVVTVSVLIVQMATGTFSARYMRIFYRDWAFKAVLAVLIGTFTFSYTLMRYVEADSVPNFGVTIAGSILGLGILLFVIFLDRAIHRLRPVAVAALVAKAGEARSARFSRRPREPARLRSFPLRIARRASPCSSSRMERGGAIQAIDVRRARERGRTRTRASSSFAIRSATSSRQGRH